MPPRFCPPITSSFPIEVRSEAIVARILEEQFGPSAGQIRDGLYRTTGGLFDQALQKQYIARSLRQNRHPN